MSAFVLQGNCKKAGYSGRCEKNSDEDLMECLHGLYGLHEVTCPSLVPDGLALQEAL